MRVVRCCSFGLRLAVAGGEKYGGRVSKRFAVNLTAFFLGVALACGWGLSYSASGPIPTNTWWADPSGSLPYGTGSTPAEAITASLDIWTNSVSGPQQWAVNNCGAASGGGTGTLSVVCQIHDMHAVPVWDGTSSAYHTCVSPKIHDGATVFCIDPVPEEPCPTGDVKGYVAATADPYEVCFGGCSATLQFASNQFAIGGVQVIGGTWTYNPGFPSQVCNFPSANGGDPATLTAAPRCASGTCIGQVNGQWVCLACSSAPVPLKTVATATKSSTDANVTTTDKTVTTLTDGPGGISVISTTIKTSSDPLVPSSTSSKAETLDPGTYCSLHPTEAICKAAVDACIENPDRVGCAELGTPADGQTLGTLNVGSGSITPVALGGAGSCPANIQLAHGAVFSYAPLCQYATSLKPVLLLIAWLSAGLILVGGFRD